MEQTFAIWHGLHWNLYLIITTKYRHSQNISFSSVCILQHYIRVMCPWNEVLVFELDCSETGYTWSKSSFYEKDKKCDKNYPFLHILLFCIWLAFKNLRKSRVGGLNGNRQLFPLATSQVIHCLHSQNLSSSLNFLLVILHVVTGSEVYPM